ncbi:hypothetical protein P4203_28455 [Pseudomonas aeruginosa]|nr:hypothetical protein [Pseudomonas aeruginosa]
MTARELGAVLAAIALAGLVASTLTYRHLYQDATANLKSLSDRWSGRTPRLTPSWPS